MFERVSFEIEAGDYIAITGPSGGGKTTLLKVMLGLLEPTAGEILVDGTAVHIRNPAQARDLGIAYVPEDRGVQGLIKPQSVAENVAHAILSRITRWLMVDRAQERSLSVDLIARLGIRARGPEQIVRAMSRSTAAACCE